MKKILSIFGTRPEAIKICPLLIELSNRPLQFQLESCVTAQHRHMLDQVLSLFKIIPTYDLDLMKNSKSLPDITSKILLGVDDILAKSNPDLVVVHGDTTTAFSAALAAFYRKIPIAHIEAGLRTWDSQSPWPEEFNRRSISVISSLNFAPTRESADNLIHDHIANESIFITGNTVIDALKYAVHLLEESPTVVEKFKLKYGFLEKNKKTILVTGHRRESFGAGFEEICKAIKIIATNRGDTQVIYPVHLNPLVRQPVNNILGNVKAVHLIEPVDYLEFIYLMMQSSVILTDSGGVQEEAPSLNKPVLVMRERTERPDGLNLGLVKLVGVNSEKIVNAVFHEIDSLSQVEEKILIDNPYGDGLACKRIADILTNYLS